jgi:hypothetical protein
VASGKAAIVSRLYEFKGNVSDLAPKQSIAKEQESDKIVLHNLLNSLDFYSVILTRYFSLLI